LGEEEVVEEVDLQLVEVMIVDIEVVAVNSRQVEASFVVVVVVGGNTVDLVGTFVVAEDTHLDFA